MAENGRIYHCFKCDKFYPRFRLFMLHKIKYHMKRKQDKQQCDICPSLSFSTEVVKKMHYFNRHTPGKCKLCGISCIDKDELLQHCFSHNFLNQWPYQCSVCNSGFVTSLGIATHIGHCGTHLEYNEKNNSPFDFLKLFPLPGNEITEIKPGIKCRSCGKRFQTFFAWKRHQRVYHNEKEIVENETANSESSGNSESETTSTDDDMGKYHTEHSYAKVKKGQLTKKKKRKHKKVKCAECDEGFKDKVTLMRHIKQTHIVSLKDSVCNVCGKKAFQCRRDYTAHIAAHRGEVLIKCHICNVPFTTTGNLKAHIALKHDQSKMKYECHFCHKKYFHKYPLDIHLNTHTKERQYLCNICGKIFYVRDSMRLHMAHHEGRYKKKPRKPCTCEYCGKICSSSWAYKDHVRKHTGEEPFVCQHCGKSYKQKSGLAYHIKKALCPKSQ